MIQRNAVTVGDRLFNASRQVWLAGLGAAVVTREWAEREAGVVFRNLVREGTLVESRAMRVVGDRLETSFVQANTIWKRARSGVTTAVRTYADTAATLVRDTLPASLPRLGVGAEAPAKRKAVRGAKRAVTTTKASARRTRRTPKAVKRG